MHGLFDIVKKDPRPKLDRALVNFGSLPLAKEHYHAKEDKDHSRSRRRHLPVGDQAQDRGQQARQAAQAA
jgi:hypothetical protein